MLLLQLYMFLSVKVEPARDQNKDYWRPVQVHTCGGNCKVGPERYAMYFKITIIIPLEQWNTNNIVKS